MKVRGIVLCAIPYAQREDVKSRGYELDASRRTQRTRFPRCGAVRPPPRRLTFQIHAHATLIPGETARTQREGSNHRSELFIQLCQV